MFRPSVAAALVLAGTLAPFSGSAKLSAQAPAQTPPATAQAATSAVPVDEIVAKNLAARGGLEKLKAVQSIKQTAHLNTQGLETTLTMYAKRPNMTRQEVAVGTQTVLNAFDGTTAWTVNPLTGSPAPTVITGPSVEVIRQESEFDTPLVDYKARGFTIDFVGAESVGGRRMLHLKIGGKDRAPQECYLDADTNLEARTVSQSPMGTLAQEFWDYRDVQGIKMPYSLRTLQNGTTVATITVQSIELNGPMADSLFKKPEGR
jgi:hypothetical protein